MGEAGEQPGHGVSRADLGRIAGELDSSVDRLAGHLAGLADDRGGLVELHRRWLDVAETLEEHSPVLAGQARRLGATLGQLDDALGRMSQPIGAFVGAAGRTADTARAMAD